MEYKHLFSETSYTIKIFCLMQLTCCDVKWAVMIVFSDFHLSSKTISQHPAPYPIIGLQICNLQYGAGSLETWCAKKIFLTNNFYFEEWASNKSQMRILRIVNFAWGRLPILFFVIACSCILCTRRIIDLSFNVTIRITLKASVSIWQINHQANI